MNIEEIYKLTKEQLISEIEKHNKLYWEKNAPEISDDEYDLLMQRLEELNPEHPLLKLVGTLKVASIGKVHLNKPMISLDKTYFFKDAPKGKKSLLKWAEENSRNEDELFLIQPKYDGISASFSNGILATRGQGTEDENVTDKVPLIELEATGYKGHLNRDARGEIVIRNDDFKTIYSEIVKADGKSYKNSRNAVGGIMGLKDISDMLRQHAKLTLVDYDMVSFKVKFKDIEKEWEKILEKIEELPYPMDGIVVKLADEAYSESLGYTAHHPRGQIAFKFSGVRKKTKLIGVEWSFGKSCLTPVARVEPIDIGGVTICNVTLHNLANVEEKDICIGDIVTVERAGDVIPHIVESEAGEDRKTCIISECPSCSSKLVRDDKELMCVNPDCFETKLQRILASVRNIGIEELGEPNIRKMMNVLGIKKLADIFNLTIDDILKLEGFKQKSAANLYNSIQKARNTTDYQLLASLNIRGLGLTSAEKLLRRYTLKELRNLTQDELMQIDQVGPAMSESIYGFFQRNSDVIDELIKVLEISETKGDSVSENIRTICFTGEMPEKRSYYEATAAKNGYKSVDTVTKELSLLVTADKDFESTKARKAKSIGVEIITLDEWLNNINGAKINNEEKPKDKEGFLPGF